MACHVQLKENQMQMPIRSHLTLCNKHRRHPKHRYSTGGTCARIASVCLLHQEEDKKNLLCKGMYNV